MRDPKTYVAMCLEEQDTRNVLFTFGTSAEQISENVYILRKLMILKRGRNYINVVEKYLDVLFRETIRYITGLFFAEC